MVNTNTVCCLLVLTYSVWLIEGNVHQVLVHFPHFSTVCKETWGCSTRNRNLMKCSPSYYHNYVNASATSECQRQCTIRNQSKRFEPTPGFQLVNDMNCSNQGQSVDIQTVVYKLAKQYDHQCPFNNKSDCAGMTLGSCRTITCTLVKVTGAEICEMEDSNVTLSMRKYCKDSGSICTGYKLSRKPMLDHKCLFHDTNQFSDTANLTCYALSAQINYTCSEGKVS